MLERTLTSFADRMKELHPNMNYGGCAVFAVHMAKRLEKVVPTRIKLFSWDKWDLDVIRPTLSNPLDIDEWAKHVECFCHLVVEFDHNGQTYHYDTDGLRLATTSWRGDYLADGHFTIEEVSSFTAAQNLWNSMFDRAQIPAVKRRVKNLFARQIYTNQLTKYQRKQKLTY